MVSVSAECEPVRGICGRNPSGVQRQIPYMARGETPVVKVRGNTGNAVPGPLKLPKQPNLYRGSVVGTRTAAVYLQPLLLREHRCDTVLTAEADAAERDLLTVTFFSVNKSTDPPTYFSANNCSRSCHVIDSRLQ